MEIFSLFKKSLNDFLNEKLLKTSGNNAKVAGKGNFWMSYFKSVGIWIKMKIIKKKVQLYASTCTNKAITVKR